MESGAERVDLSRIQFTPELLSYVPAELARTRRVLPIFRHGETLTIAVAKAPPDLNDVDEVFHVVSSLTAGIRNMTICVAAPEDLAHHVRKLYG